MIPVIGDDDNNDDVKLRLLFTITSESLVLVLTTSHVLQLEIYAKDSQN